jgi:hypothetical protein
VAASNPNNPSAPAPKPFESEDSVSSAGAPEPFGVVGSEVDVGTSGVEALGSGVTSGDWVVVGFAEADDLGDAEAFGVAEAVGVADAFVEIGTITASLFPELSGFCAGLFARQIANKLKLALLGEYGKEMIVDSLPSVVAQPMKLKLVRVGSVGALRLPFSTNDPFATGVPPLLLKVTV